MSYAGLFANNGLPLGLGSIMAFGNPNISLFEDVAALFANSEQGAWYDPSDTSTMYQDSQGTTPVTAIAQPVGLILDKSKGLTLGPELISNGGFATDTVWTKGIGWTIGSGNAQAATPLGAAAISQAEAIVSGRPYKITFNVVSISAGSVTLQFTGTGTQSGPTFTTTGLKTCILIANANYTTFGILAAIGTIATIDDVSAKELPGNHAFQTTTTKLPLWSARVNLLTKTEDFGDAVWIPANLTVTTNAVSAPDGAMTADLISMPAVSSGYSIIYRNSTTLSGTFSDSVYLRGVNGGEIVYLFYLVDGVYVNKECVLTTSWQKFSFSFSGGTVCFWHLGVDLRAGSGQTAKPAQTIYAWGASLVPADQASLPYQRVNTATDYDSVGFNKYLAFDGVDDALVTNSIDFTATDKMTVWAGVRKLSDTARGIIAELSATSASNNGAFGMTAPNAASATYAFESKGTALTDAVGTPFAAPLTSVLTGIASIASDVNILRVNGTQADSDTGDQGTGNYGNYPLYIGSRAGTSLPFNGNLYSLIVRGAQSSDAQIASTEQYVNSKTGAY